ncbi:MAG: hypothetical protein M1817_004677 [Caeruleum heppii]|nr:MAG: hypothetical protein M1817_004677 [Caeruleum heppii]
MRRPSADSIKSVFCDGPLPDAHSEDGMPREAILAALNNTGLEISDRIELIERIKRGESPTWVPSRNLESQFNNAQTFSHDGLPPRPQRQSNLLPAADIRETTTEASLSPPNLPNRPEDIQRPRSALHAGDFTSQPTTQPPRDAFNAAFAPLTSQLDGLVAPPAISWHNSCSPPTLSTFRDDPRFPPARPLPHSPPEYSSRSRAPSLSSLSSSFVMKPPTSPLVQTSNNDPEYSPTLSPIDIAGSPAKTSRRHTLPPHPLLSMPSSPAAISTAAHPVRPMPSMRRDTSFPYQAHQPRRSLTSNLNFRSNAHTPIYSRTRRPSLSETSPLHHAPMVGSYEESILRGRMSTVPSKPLNFVAQIGVLGLGDCKPSLRCPAHVSVPFPAVFYSYGSANVGRSDAEDQPSPYVGLVDLENSLNKPSEPNEIRRRARHVTLPSGPSSPTSNAMIDEHSRIKLLEHDLRRREKRKRRSTSPKTPTGGSYRIPQKGQLQIIIKNPNKTAVKLFLVPYDLQGMEAGTKTFVRQRSYSAGPIIDMAPSELTKASPEPKTDSKDRPTLRYLIHLHICCPSPGRYYLYKSIRVVFANRVPDGKEKLHNEMQLPEPRYSPYKAAKEAYHPTGGAALVADKMSKRASSGGYSLAVGGLDTMDGLSTHPTYGDGAFHCCTPFPYRMPSPSLPIQPIPFTLAKRTLPLSIGRPESRDVNMDAESSQSTGPTMAKSPPGFSMPDSVTVNYGKLNRGDVGYGGNAFLSGSVGGEASEGLLARKLRGLDVERDLEGGDDEQSGIE